VYVRRKADKKRFSGIYQLFSSFHFLLFAHACSFKKRPFDPPGPAEHKGVKRPFPNPPSAAVGLSIYIVL
jgi:hypothetical protein